MINQKGEEILKPQFSEVSHYTNYEKGVVIGKSKDNDEVVSLGGRVIVQNAQFLESKYDLVLFKTNEGVGVYNLNIEQTQYLDLDSLSFLRGFKDPPMVSYKDRNLGMLSSELEKITDEQFGQIEHFAVGLYKLTTGDNIGFANNYEIVLSLIHI